MQKLTQRNNETCGNEDNLCDDIWIRCSTAPRPSCPHHKVPRTPHNNSNQFEFCFSTALPQKFPKRPGLILGMLAGLQHFQIERLAILNQAAE